MLNMTCEIKHNGAGWTWTVSQDGLELARSLVHYADWQECLNAVFHIGKFMFQGAPDQLDISDSKVVSINAKRGRKA